MPYVRPAASRGSWAVVRWAGAALATLSLACGGGGDGGPAASAPLPSVPPPIAVQPQDEVLTSGQTATFGVVAQGQLPLTYQWFRNGTAISGATAATYRTPAATLGDSGASYSVTVTSAAGATTSRSAMLTVVASGAVTTFAGTAGSSGAVDGLGASARFSAPGAIVSDAQGDLFLADTGNHTIRRIDPAGNVATVAGTAGIAGSADGNGAAARFNQPSGLAVDNAGNLYVSDSGNRTIRKVSPTGDVTTLAGTAGVYGASDGTGPSASFAFPQGIAVDGAGTVFVCDAYNNTLRAISAAGVVTTLAGTAGASGTTDGTGAAARFNLPTGLALDGSGNLFVADGNNHAIRRVTPAGVVTTFAGSAGTQGLRDGTGTAARFFAPAGLVLDGAGNLFVADAGNHCIRRVDAAGAVTTQAGSPLRAGSADGTGASASFGRPAGVAASGSNVFIGDPAFHTVRRLIPGS